MNTLHQTLMPKHQLLIHKCYPRYQKSEVRANPSELSYLLYYASTRRSKLPKVASYLDKKTASDVNKTKTGNIQVTLEIAKSLIEKTPRDLPLYATYILRILLTILHSKDLSTIEESVPVFEAFCHHNYATFFAGENKYVEQYEEVIDTYASYAALKLPFQPKGGLNAPTALRWRIAGLKAMKCATSSEALEADSGTQMSKIMPAILQNLHAGDGHSLTALQRRSTDEKSNDDNALRRRISVATVQTNKDPSRPTTAEVDGATDDADRIAEEEVSLLAIQGLKQIFTPNNGSQIRSATDAMLKFVCTKALERRPATSRSSRSLTRPSWANTLTEMVTQWAPVQDRFIILITMVDYLAKIPATEDGLEQQITLVSLIDWLLSSDVNMIGLSVIDVLLSLLKQILVNLQLPSDSLPHHHQTKAIDIFKSNDPAENSQAMKGSDDETLPSSNRQLLLNKLHHCIGNLVTHLYYSDQVLDIVTTILQRLKPTRSTKTSPKRPTSASNSLSEEQASKAASENPEEFFSFGTARVTALKAIKRVLIVANGKTTAKNAPSMGRSRAGIKAWEGTQWLMYDEDRRVRRAYVDALMTWLSLEMSSNDVRVLEHNKLQRRPSKREVRPKDGMNNDDLMLKKDTSSLKTDDSKPQQDDATLKKDSNMSKTSVSTPQIDDITSLNESAATKMDEDLPHRTSTNRHKASWEETQLKEKSIFLQQLHLAVYETALESPESEPDILLLHLLLADLVERLGVNAVETGLPMILRLQEDINNDLKATNPIAKINIGSLVHGYLWKLTSKFAIEGTTVGFVIQSEIQRRKRAGLWMDGIRIPPGLLDDILAAPSRARTFDPNRPSPSELATMSIRPFDSRAELVDRIAASYAAAPPPPTASPPASPTRIFSTDNPAFAKVEELPQKMRDTMLNGPEFRPSTSSSAAGEDPDANLAALRGEPPRPSGEYADEVPPVPPLPTTIPVPTRPLSQGLPPGHPGLAAGSKERRQERRSTSGKEGVDVDALLASIDVGKGEGRKWRQGRRMGPPS
ncbi:uncharacterized protein KY384_000876 [Bacidia gigantensis]|uniref:uncharacterized protein n=1 Tax=Bacidia gigantensis TaxID=2732470 RepID=UPI001D03F20F|nr:uncharacterized protein KY384_000876 [Bacidia gigantensis]KAG8534033.1 hypothetical protein KY384_000876 [Bacidia gigantensis]